MFEVRKSYLLCFIFMVSGSLSVSAQTWFKKGEHLCGARSAKEKPFLEAVKKGDAGLIEKFLQKGADASLKDDCNIPVITYAASINRPDILKILVKSGANVNAIDEFDNQPPLLRIIKKFNFEDEREKIYESVQILINGGADVNLTDKSEKSALIVAVLCGEEQLTKILISAGADVNFKDDEERTAYSYAAQSGNIKLKKILIENGADTTIGVAEYEKQYGENAFFQASADGRTDVVEAMLNAGMNVNAINTGKMTALMRATEDSTVDLLINAGTNVNLKDNAGFTALIWAAAFHRKNQIIKLIAAGADVNAQTSDGKTALDFVTNPEIRTVLIEAGAKTK
jgi:ankyrin repeat protein